MAKEHIIVEAIEISTEFVFLIYLVIIVYQLIHSKKKYWALYFAFPISILFSFSILNNILKAIGFNEFLIFKNQNLNFYLLLIVAFLFYFLAFNLINKSKAILPLAETTKYKNSNLNQQLIEQYKADLLTCMQVNKLYLDGKLSIQDVSDHLNVPRQYISEVLNVHMHTNFQDFVNQYRVEEFVNRLKNDKNNHFTLLGIAKDVGFNSKSSFYVIFKKLKGMTPAQFKNELQNKSK
jgi:AraC-like DNA-binding protein